MSVAKVIEISASSPESFDAAIREGVAKASQTVKNIRSAWVQDQQVSIENGKVTEYRVLLKLTFVLE